MKRRMDTKTKIACAKTAYRIVSRYRRLWGRADRVVAVRNGFTWDLDLGEGIEFAIYLLGAFEWSTVRAYERIIRPGDVVLDIGANIGAHTLPIARCVGPQGRVIAIEPTVAAFHKLTRNVALNPSVASQVVMEQALLTDGSDRDEGEGAVYASWPLRASDATHPIHQGKRETIIGSERIGLDALLDRMRVVSVDCIKIDVDGHECAVLRGAEATLKKWRPSIIMELLPYGLEEHGGSFEELIELVRGHGYKLFHLHGSVLLPSDPRKLFRMIPSRGSINALAMAQ
jgi:FkbM family methyltransferase